MTGQFPTKTIAVTGAGGFIGSHIVARLRSEGHEVRSIFGPADQISHILKGDCVCDIHDRKTLTSVVDGCDTIVHLAGPPSVAMSFSKPSLSATIHAGGTAVLTEVAAEANVERFVYCSSAEVYGQAANNPVTETDSPNPVSPYGASKAAAEWIVRASAISNQHEAVILRPFTVYGPGLASRSLLGLIIDQASNNAAVELMNLAPIRDYVYIDDVVDAFVRACGVELTQRVNICNIGTGQGSSVRQLAETVVRVLGRNIPVLETGQRDRPQELDIHELVANLSASTEVLGWTPQTSLEAGIRKFSLPRKQEAAA
ncbi:MAG: NAD-dependent epimerase/dehydratase family protein [Planctomycetaceae bacterium]